MTDSNIYTARDAWVSNPTAAEATYGHISTWDTSGVTDMEDLFCGSSSTLSWAADCNTAAASFNEDIGAWDTSGVTTMRQMFHSASAFNQDIGGWAVQSVTSIVQMFMYASAFDQDLGWCLDDDVDMNEAFYNSMCSSTSCGVGFIGNSRCPDYDGDGVVDAAPEGECCVSAYGQPFTDACGTTLTEVEASGCCPDDFLLRYSHDIYEKSLTDYTRWDCVSFVDKEACDLKGPPYTWGSCWHSAYDQAAATCKTCTEAKGFDVKKCGRLFMQEAKGKWGDWYSTATRDPYCHEHSCCASGTGDCCEPNPAAIAGAVVVGFAVLAGLIGLCYKCCRKPAIAEPSEATSPKEEGATAVAPEAEESPQETLTEEAPPPSPATKSWFWRGEPKPEPEGEAEETLAEEPPAPPAQGWFTAAAEPEGEPESYFAPEAEDAVAAAERPPPPGSWFSRAAPEPEPEFEPEPEA